MFLVKKEDIISQGILHLTGSVCLVFCLINVCLFALKMIALSDVAELNMFVARSAQPMISLLLSFCQKIPYSKGESDYR